MRIKLFLVCIILALGTLAMQYLCRELGSKAAIGYAFDSLLSPILIVVWSVVWTVGVGILTIWFRWATPRFYGRVLLVIFLCLLAGHLWMSSQTMNLKREFIQIHHDTKGDAMEARLADVVSAREKEAHRHGFISVSRWMTEGDRDQLSDVYLYVGIRLD